MLLVLFVQAVHWYQKLCVFLHSVLMSLLICYFLFIIKKIPT